jgi:E3 ubiquitin-protein ligase RNF13
MISVTGRSYGMTIPAVFVTKSAGEALAKFSVNEAASVQILPDYEDTIWSVMVFMLILLLAIAAGLVTWCFVKRNRNRRRSRFKGPCVISSRIVEAMPTEVYRIIGNEKAAQESCTICLEEYIPGEILRVLPCSHSE